METQGTLWFVCVAGWSERGCHVFPLNVFIFSRYPVKVLFNDIATIVESPVNSTLIQISVAMELGIPNAGLTDTTAGFT